MFGILKRKSPPLVGLDISSTAVKLLELSQVGERYRVESFAVAPLATDAVVEKAIKDPEEVSRAVREVLARSRTRLNHAAFALPDSSVMTKVIQMDASLTDNEIETQIALEADKYIPYPLEEVSLDFQVIGPSVKNNNVVDVLLAASRTENVDSWVETIAEADITVKIVDVESYAMERACSLITQHLPNVDESKNIAVIDIGSTMTNLTVLRGETTVFTREEVFGGEQLTKEIQRHYGLSYAEAGLAKKQGNLPDDYVTEVLDPFKETAVVQIRRSLQFFFSANQDNEISHVILAGGTVTIPGLAAMIEEQIGVPTAIANPFSDMMVASRVNAASLAKDAPALMIACGLAMRSYDKGETISD